MSRYDDPRSAVMARKALYSLIFLFLSCSVPQKAETPLAESETVEVERNRIVDGMRSLSVEEKFKELRAAGKKYLSKYGYSDEALEVRLLVGAADLELGFLEEAFEILSPLTEENVPPPVRFEAYLLLADVDRGRGLFKEAAAGLLEAVSLRTEEAEAEKARESLAGIVKFLMREQLEELSREYALSPGIDLVLAERLAFARGVGDTVDTRRILDEMTALDSGRPPVDVPPQAAPLVTPEFRRRGDRRDLSRIGLLCPLKGRFFALGEAFLRGASLAVLEAKKRGIGNYELVVGDTRGDPLVARAAAQKLVSEEQVEALVGCVLSSPTIAAAQVAQYSRTVLLSPVASEEGIDEIGVWVFQTHTYSEVEVLSVVRAATDILGLKRVAFLSVDDLQSRQLEFLFKSEMERCGADLCISEFYSEGSTDFLGSIERIRAANPEGLYIASGTDDLVLILPQLSFYEFGIQLLGPSSWNSSRLLRMVGRDMEGAVFPADIGSEENERSFSAATALVGVPGEEANPFIVAGYKGVRMLIEAVEAVGGGDALRDELARTLNNRRHPFLDLLTGGGIPFFTVRNERLEEFTTLQVSP